jgi:hypothetical protein
MNIDAQEKSRSGPMQLVAWYVPSHVPVTEGTVWLGEVAHDAAIAADAQVIHIGT